MAFDVAGAKAAGYTEAEIAEHLAKSAGFDLAAARSASYSDSEVVAHLASGASLKPAKPTVLQRIKDTVTGNLRRVETTEALPDWASMPELNSLSFASAKSGLGTLFASPEEAVKVIQANYPGVKVAQDAQGSYLLTSSLDGKQYAIKPGFRASDIPRAVGTAAAFTPAGRATSIAGAGTKTALTQGVIEATQAATGGEFNPGDVAVAGVAGAAVPAVFNATRAGMQALRPARPAPSPAATAAPVAPPAAAVAPPAQPAMPAGSPMATADELGQSMRTAALGGIGSKKATGELIAQAAPDAEIMASAQRLGIAEHLQPDHVTTNQAFRQLLQLVKSQTGSTAAVAQREGLEKVAIKANKIVEQVGGTADVSTLSETVKQGMRQTEQQLKSQAKNLYMMVDDAIKPATPIEAPNIVAAIRKNAADLGGEANISSVEKDLLKRLSGDSGKPTYGLLDKLRKDIGEAKRGKQNAFGTSNLRELSTLETALRADQAGAAKAAGVSDVWELAQATSKQYKALQDDLSGLFGKELDKSAAPFLKTAVKTVGEGDTGKFLKLMEFTPPEMRQEVVASGLSSFFQRTTRGGEMNFAGYARWFDGLQKNKKAYTAVMSNLPPETVRSLKDLANVARGVAMAKGEFIATGKAINPKVLEAADTMAGKFYDEVRRRGVSGIAAEVMGSTAGAPGLASALASATMRNRPSILQAADALIASPEFIAAAKAAGTPSQQKAAAALAYSKPFTKFVRAVGNPETMTDRERWVLQAMQQSTQATTK